MTRFQQTENTAHTSPAHGEITTAHPNYSGGAQQHNFSEYTMPSTSSRTANPNNVQGQALQNAQTYQPTQTARTYQPAQTYSPAQTTQTYSPAQTTQTYAPTQTARTYQPTTNPASTAYNYNTGNNGNNWNNQNQQNQWYREMQLRQLQQQEALQASLYYGATSAYGYPNQGYDYGSQWTGDPSYQYGTNYNGQFIPGQQNLGYQDPRYNQGNGVDYAGGSGFDANGNPIGVQGGNGAIDYSAGATYDQSGNLINPNGANYSGVQGNPVYRPVQDGANYAGGQGNPNNGQVQDGANYAGAQGNPIYRPVPGGANYAGAQGADQNYQGRIPAQPDPSMYAGGDRYAQAQRQGQDQIQGQGQGQGRRRQYAPQNSGSCPDLTESSFEDGPTPSASGPIGRVDSPVQSGDASQASQGNGHWTAAEGGANWSQYDFSVYKHLNDQAKALVGHSIQEFDKNVPVRLGCARAISLLVNQGYGFNTTDASVANLEQDLRKNGFTQVSVKDMQPGDVICGYRAKGDYPHGALYLGNGQIFNNDSNSGVMKIQSIAKLNNSSFKNFVVLRRPATVPAVQGDARTAQS